MGMTFTTAHIHNSQTLTKAQFKKAFTDMMKEKGYASCDEEDASVTYSLVFSPDLKWVTALTDRTDISREAADLALELRTKCVVIDLVDSDFAELSLFDEGGAHKDTLTLGDSYLEDAAPMGSPPRGSRFCAARGSRFGRYRTAATPLRRTPSLSSRRLSAWTAGIFCLIMTVPMIMRSCCILKKRRRRSSL